MLVACRDEEPLPSRALLTFGHLPLAISGLLVIAFVALVAYLAIVG